MQAGILSLHTPATGGVGSKGQNIFSECSYVEYQIKGKEAYTNIQEKDFEFTHTPDSWSG